MGEYDAKIKKITHYRDYLLDITFTNGFGFRYDFKKDILSCCGLAELNDIERSFTKFRIANSGSIIEWEHLDIQIGADTLWLEFLETDLGLKLCSI